MTEPTPPTLPGLGVSIVRTAIPVAWGAVVAWLVGLGLPAEVAAAVDRVDELLVLVCAAAVYAGVRWLERQRWMPLWLARVLLGSAQQPMYLTAPAGIIAISQPLTEPEAAELRERWIRDHGSDNRQPGP